MLDLLAKIFYISMQKVKQIFLAQGLSIFLYLSTHYFLDGCLSKLLVIKQKFQITLLRLRIIVFDNLMHWRNFTKSN